MPSYLLDGRAVPEPHDLVPDALQSLVFIETVSVQLRILLAGDASL